MANKIFRSTLFVAAIVLVCSVGIILGVMYEYFDGFQTMQLDDELTLAQAGTEQNGLQYLNGLHYDSFRITWIGSDGRVLFDSKASSAGMENHGSREEIQQAFHSGRGSSTRYSSTLTEKTRYEAVRMNDGSVLRISTSQASTVAVLWGMLKPVVFILLVAVSLSAFLAKRMAKRIVQPINRLNLENPLENKVYEEITPLLKRINQQHLQISEQIRTLKQKNDEFRQITGSMQEGLVLLDREDRVLHMNPAAARVLCAQGDVTGRDFLTMDESREMRSAVDQVFLNGKSSLRALRQGRCYQFDLNRIASGGSVIGAVILIFDVTEQENAEKNRREFSANVSHELKTPLQAIMGSAELMENHLVKPEDQPRLMQNIRKEAQRMVNLIEDIIRLSQLDEGVSLQPETVDLRELAGEVISVLEPSAEKKHVTFHLEGGSLPVQGVRRLIYEIVYNLCDNAVRYNVEGGCVTVRLDSGGPSLTVEDTGIGIPPEHRERVFERFYRVDKSHSRQSGGTGLGLSIVKHAAKQLGAEIRMESRPGQGTKVQILF